MGRDLGAGPFDNFLQLDAPINPGNSGGPAFNMDGQVIGMTTAIVSPTGGSVGIGFAIPSETVRPIVAELRAKGRVDRGWLGVALRDADAPAAGAVIAAVERNSPALQAGLHPGDVVVGINGEAIDTSRAPDPRRRRRPARPGRAPDGSAARRARSTFPSRSACGPTT